MTALLCGFCLLSLLLYVVGLSVLVTPRSRREIPGFIAQIFVGCVVLVFMCLAVL